MSPNETAAAPAEVKIPASPSATATADQPPQRVASQFGLDILKLVDQEKQTTTIKSLIDVETERQTFEMDQRKARSFAQSGYFSDITGLSLEQAVAQAMTKIELGREWGLSRADSMQSIFFTNGRPAIQNQIVAAALQLAGYGWEPEWTFEDTKDDKGQPWKRCTGCTLYVTKNGAPMLDRRGNQVEVSFTANDADHFMVFEGQKTKPLSEKFNFKSFGKDMYYWRCISRLHKYYAPAVLRGGRVHEVEQGQVIAEVEPDDSQLKVLDAAASETVNPLRELVLDADKEE